MFLKNKKQLFRLVIACVSISFLISPINLNSERNKYNIKTGSYPSNNQEIDYLIITIDNYVSQMEKLAEWKMQKGLYVEMITLDEIDNEYIGVDMAAKIKECIIDYYTNAGTCWVCLAGDAEEIPTRTVYAPEDYVYDGEYVSADFYYSDLDNDWDADGDQIWGEKDDDEYDFFPEVYIGRLSGNNPEEMQHLVNNIISYESCPPPGDWLKRTLYAGSFITFASEGDDDGICDFPALDVNRYNHFVAESLENQTNYSWNELYLAESEGLSPSTYFYNDTINENNVMAALNDGAAFGIIMGHGTPYRMVQFLFTNDTDGDGLMDYSGDVTNYSSSYMIEEYAQPNFITTDSNFNTSQDRLGFYVLGGCSVGTFDVPEDCLTEVFLKTCAIGCIGSSQVTWAEDGWDEREHGGWYLDGLMFRFFEQLMNNSHPGQALAEAKADYIEDTQNPNYSLVNPPWNFPYYPEWEDKVLKQTNLFGDPEVNIWLDIPKNFQVKKMNTSNHPTYEIRDKTSQESLSNVIVTINNGNEFIWRNETDEQGKIEIPFAQNELEKYDLTFYLEDYLPYQELFQDKPSISGFDFSLLWFINTIGVSWLIYKIRLQKYQKK